MRSLKETSDPGGKGMRKLQLKAAGTEADKPLGTKRPETLGTGASEAREAAEGKEVKNRRDLSRAATCRELGVGAERTGEHELGRRKRRQPIERVRVAAFGFGRVCGACVPARCVPVHRSPRPDDGWCSEASLTAGRSMGPGEFRGRADDRLQKFINTKLIFQVVWFESMGN
jgi:hypothetical protein